ncbi:alpha/beta hydrolase family protein [Domibacillus enclensis]|uniref:Alpha/beta hydrolase n=1 Tax=Domibacillus enclensis TaxID=1017273 RepID=A0A1N7AB03_9BACI|nr:alpha/beta hydrolase [Domibacillus enclensis]OXS75760.1 alpha/beta hydrolase [Domibacillus enclensis]SIR36295.1 hypothetical protein SAMN05443094_107140 [Domibacillus enclensis]
MIADKHSMEGTIQKTLFTARLFDGFWERWVAHGIDEEEIKGVRPLLTDKESWVRLWAGLAFEKTEEAACFLDKGNRFEAETLYRKAGLYYQFVQWLIPEGNEKKIWMEKSVLSSRLADQLSAVVTTYTELSLDGKAVSGRVRKPMHPQGVVIMVNPIDSAKEELFSYETDFATSGFVTLNFDGPGQGETFSVHGLKATKQNWEMYVDRIIHYAKSCFPSMPIYLFGTSSGAAWALYGSGHSDVVKAAAVSPAFLEEKRQMPDYFTERLTYISENNQVPLPSLLDRPFHRPIYLFHGKQDVMVSDQHIDLLFEQLPEESKLKEYENEGHCCNFKLGDIRQLAMDWFAQ